MILRISKNPSKCTRVQEVCLKQKDDQGLPLAHQMIDSEA